MTSNKEKPGLLAWMRRPAAFGKRRDAASTRFACAHINPSASERLADASGWCFGISVSAACMAFYFVILVIPPRTTLPVTLRSVMWTANPRSLATMNRASDVVPSG